MKVELEDIKALRLSTEAGLLDCRKALQESGGDREAAEALLKEWGLVAMRKREDRETREGKVFIHAGEDGAAMVELACETDFASLSPLFTEAGERMAEGAWRRRLTAPDAGLLDILSGLASQVKEKLEIRRVAYLARPSGGRLETYLHGEGRIGVLLAVRADREGAFTDGRILAMIHDVALHIAAFKPDFVDKASLPPAAVEALKEELRQGMAGDEAMGAKPPALREGILAGMLEKRLRERSLLAHGFVRDEKRPLAAVLGELRTATGIGLEPLAFACFEAGA